MEKTRIESGIYGFTPCSVADLLKDYGVLRGQTKAGLGFLLEVFEKLPYLERDLGVSDTEPQCLKDAKNVVSKIYNNVVELI